MSLRPKLANVWVGLCLLKLANVQLQYVYWRMSGWRMSNRRLWLHLHRFLMTTVFSNFFQLSFVLKGCEGFPLKNLSDVPIIRLTGGTKIKTNHDLWKSSGRSGRNVRGHLADLAWHRGLFVALVGLRTSRVWSPERWAVRLKGGAANPWKSLPSVMSKVGSQTWSNDWKQWIKKLDLSTW